MAKRQKAWARKARVTLLCILGKICRHCGSTNDLEFDCIVAQGDEHHKMDTSARMSFYHREYRKNNLQVLCDKCHRAKTTKEKENQPF